MKNIILPLAFVILVLHYVCSNESIFSKFHQHTYKLKDARMDLFSYNKDYFNIFEIKTFKYNRTTVAHNITINMKFDVKDKLEVVEELFKFLSNEYRPMAVRFQHNIYKACKSNLGGLRAISKCGNSTWFYFYKDITYHSCNFVIDDTQLPPLIPNGMYKVEQTILLDNKEIAVINVYGEIYAPIAYPRK